MRLCRLNIGVHRLYWIRLATGSQWCCCKRGQAWTASCTLCSQWGLSKHRTNCTDREIAVGKAQINYCDPVINLYTACRTSHDDSMQKFNREIHFLTTYGWPAGWNSDEIPHQLTNSTETAHRYRTELLYDRHPDKHYQNIKVVGLGLLQWKHGAEPFHLHRQNKI